MEPKSARVAEKGTPARNDGAGSTVGYWARFVMQERVGVWAMVGWICRAILWITFRRSVRRCTVEPPHLDGS
jgi:hypothetical protein